MSEKNNGNNDIRQVNISSLNESVNLLSSYPDESMNYLTDKAISLLDRIRVGNKK